MCIEEFVESHCAQPQMDDVCEEFVEGAKKEHIDASGSHYTQLQVDEDLVYLATNIANDNLMILTTRYAMTIW